MTALEAPPHSPDEPPATGQLSAGQPPPGQTAAESPLSAPPTCSLVGLIQRHQAGIWRYVRYLGATASEADDLTQETFLAVARSDFEERDLQQTAAYLRSVARNQLLVLRRRQRRQVSTVEVEAAEAVWAASAGEDGSLSDYLAALRECTDELSGRPRDAIELHYRSGASREAIAERLEMKPDGVKSLLRRTRELLRECVERKINSADRPDKK
ncbi:MAG: sigma-70 family RNA polymerase sigma factor [Pirellulales bacterium]